MKQKHGGQVPLKKKVAKGIPQIGETVLDSLPERVFLTKTAKCQLAASHSFLNDSSPSTIAEKSIAPVVS